MRQVTVNPNGLSRSPYFSQCLLTWASSATRPDRHVCSALGLIVPVLGIEMSFRSCFVMRPRMWCERRKKQDYRKRRRIYQRKNALHALSRMTQTRISGLYFDLPLLSSRSGTTAIVTR